MFSRINQSQSEGLRFMTQREHVGKRRRFRTETYNMGGSIVEFSEWAYKRPITITSHSKKEAIETAKFIEKVLENDLIETPPVVYKTFMKP